MKNKGFSLVELIVVIAIMAILVGVAVPVYTSYIGKANAAKDEQLLGEINSAFMVAAVDNQIDFDDITPNNNKITIDANGVVKFDDMYDDIVDTMKTILPGELKFNTITSLYYNPLTREFGTTVVASYGGGYVMMDPEDIAVLKDSVFGSMGMDELMDKVGYATGLVSDTDVLTNADGSLTTLGTLIMSGTDQLQAYLGFDPADPSDDTAFEAAYDELVTRRAAALANANGGDPADYEDQARLDILANNAVLIAATKSDFDTDELVTILGSEDGGIKEVLKNTQDPQTSIAKTAMAYAMYTAYMEKTNQPISDDPAVVLSTLETDGFKEFMNETDTQKDIDGYLAAMSMIDDSCNDPNAVSELLVNGFSDENLKDLLNSAIGQ